MVSDSPKNSAEKGAQVIQDATAVVDELNNVVKRAENAFEAKVAPVRKSILARFPTTFLLLVTLGVTMVFRGLDGILVQYQLFADQPWSMLLIGILILALTGRLFSVLSRSIQ